MRYGKSPGLDRASDALRHANLCGTHPAGGAVALVGDDPTAKSSTVPGGSEMLLADLGIPTLYPANPQEVLDLGLHAVAMSRASGLWTALKIITNVADGSGIVNVDPTRPNCPTSKPENDGDAYVHSVTTKLAGPTLLELERTRNGPRMEAARRYARRNGLNVMSGATVDARVGIVAAGKTFADVQQSLGLIGLAEGQLAQCGIRLLKLGMIHPLEPVVISEFSEGLSEIVVVEEKRAFIETAIKDLLFGSAAPPAVSGKQAPGRTQLFTSHGELTPDSIAPALAARILANVEAPAVSAWLDRQRPPAPRTQLPLAVRTPYFCSGCPHNSSTKTPEGSLVGGGIGCHGLAMLMSPDLVGEIVGLTQMGGEGAQWLGIAPFIARKHLLQNLGDGTFHHSGSLAVRAAVAGRIDITYKLLYNSAVAMTGGQQAVGQMNVPDLTRAMLAEGVKQIIITTDAPVAYRHQKLPRGVKVWSRDRIIEAQEKLSATAGVTMLIHDQECATELRRKRKRGLVADPVERVMINERVCEGCGDCGVQSNCLSVQPVDTDLGRKTRIDQSSCNLDSSCVKGDCPSFLRVTPGRTRAAKRVAGLRAGDLPVAAQTDMAATDHHTTRILGIGGSGVVTTSQILSVAATEAGLQVQSLDQTGLAQKGGAVVSDIKISHTPIQVASRAAEHEVDLYIGSDLLVAADPAQLSVADPRRTVAVVSTSQVPTGSMVSDVRQSFPEVTALADIIRERALGGRGIFLDARAASTALFGKDQFANLLLVGVACQTGALPIPADAIERAIELNAAQVDDNTQAFRRGRQFVGDPNAFREAVGTVGAKARTAAPVSPRVSSISRILQADPGSNLSGLVAYRVQDLAAYQNVKYASEYVEFVEKVRRIEDSATPGSTAVSEAVARHLHKLMAYKDEYEVARLSLAPELDDAVVAQFGPGARVSYQLHPPILRALGMKKIKLGPWFKIIFRSLVLARGVRGTKFDVFGYSRVRRTERQLIPEYRAAVEAVIQELRPDTAEAIVELAGLPDQVRGYESIKLGNVDAYRRAMEAAQNEVHGTVAAPVVRTGKTT